MEMNFCRRCGTPLSTDDGRAYICTNKHIIFPSMPSATIMLLTNDQKELLLGIRAHNPAKDKLAVPGGYCDPAEILEKTIAREVEEETNLKPRDYSAPEFLISAIDTYDYGGESLLVQVAVFAAKLNPNTNPVAGDDMAEVMYSAYHAIDLDNVFFPSHRAGIKFLHERGDI